MKKNDLFLAILIFVLSCSSAYAAATPAEQKLDQVVSLIEKGEFGQAQNLYKKLLEDTELTSEQKKKIRQVYEQMNIRLLFSPTKTPMSQEYEVVKGDSLYKIAEKFGTTIELLKKSNQLKNDRIFPGKKLKVVTGKFSISVDKSDNTLQLFLDETMLKEYLVATGENNQTPVGDFKIINKLENPTWFHAGAVVPPDSPENILGTRWLGLDHPGYGIHGTTLPESIGTQASAGCVRMLNHDVEELYSLVPAGTKVAITD